MVGQSTAVYGHYGCNITDRPSSTAAQLISGGIHVAYPVVGAVAVEIEPAIVDAGAAGDDLEAVDPL